VCSLPGYYVAETAVKLTSKVAIIASLDGLQGDTPREREAILGLTAQLCSQPPDIHLCSSVWQTIYEKDVAMMEKSDMIIVNLTPFAGASADAGTLIEVGWFLGKGKPIFGYSNTPENFESRIGGGAAASTQSERPLIAQHAWPAGSRRPIQHDRR
jgi:nucleoside 2-deoxyribosyltransferase